MCHALPSTHMVGARAGFERAFRTYGLPAAIRTDNGVSFAGGGLHGLTQLNVWWMRLGIQHQRIQPGRPQQNGAHERMPPRRPHRSRPLSSLPSPVSTGAALAGISRALPGQTGDARRDVPLPAPPPVHLQPAQRAPDWPGRGRRWRVGDLLQRRVAGQTRRAGLHHPRRTPVSPMFPDNSVTDVPGCPGHGAPLAGVPGRPLGSMVWPVARRWSILSNGAALRLRPSPRLH